MKQQAYFGACCFFVRGSSLTPLVKETPYKKNKKDIEIALRGSYNELVETFQNRMRFLKISSKQFFYYEYTRACLSLG
ncbi:hypothetical protein PAEVO_58930 [Paenibacillus sp. GM2FR]|nr:hypothetical protein PAEVO_58930 [Paenibacillus sp. GM2FR]